MTTGMVQGPQLKSVAVKTRLAGATHHETTCATTAAIKAIVQDYVTRSPGYLDKLYPLSYHSPELKKHNGYLALYV